MNQIKLPEFVNEDYQPYWLKEMSSAAYHEDKSAIGSSGVREMLKSAQSFLASLSHPVESTADMDFGTAVHMAILEPEEFKKTYIIEQKFKGKGSVAAREEWRASFPKETLFLDEEEMHHIEGMLNSLAKRNDIMTLMSSGYAEMTGYFRDPKTSIKCKIRPDFLNLDAMALVDIKTTKDCSYDSFSRSSWNMRYDMQLAHYCAGIKEITGKSVEYPLFVAIEKKPPYEIGAYMADEGFLSKGEEDYRRCMDHLAYCMRNNEWPYYQAQFQALALPPWTDNK